VNIDDRVLEHILNTHRGELEDGEFYCDLCDGRYPCQDVMMATIALRLGRIVDLLERRR